MSEENYRTYSSYESIEEVCDIFGYICQSGEFVQEKEYKMNEYFESVLRIDFADMKNFVNEIVICEAILRPILSNVARANDLPLFSHVRFDYNKEMGLSGESDYLLAPARAKGSSRFTTPVVCLGEAKRDNFIKGWGQVSAEMIAAQKLNENEDVPIYGLVSTGKSWEFGYLKNKTFTIDTNSLIAPKHLNEVLNSVNWIFSEARKNVDLIKKLDKEKTK